MDVSITFRLHEHSARKIENVRTTSDNQQQNSALKLTAANPITDQQSDYAVKFALLVISESERILPSLPVLAADSYGG